MIEAVVAANSAKAAQKTPVALSERFGPMALDQGSAASAPSEMVRPVGKAL